MLRFPILSAIVLLAGCGASQPLPPPGADSTVAVHIWEPGAATPTILVADRIRQEGERFDQLRLEIVRARVIHAGLDCALSSPSGSWQVRGGRLTLSGPVHIAGAWQGRPLLGVANQAELSRDGQTIILHQMELWHQGQRLTAPLAELHRDRTIIAPQGMDSTALPPELAAAFAALPDPLPMPR